MKFFQILASQFFHEAISRIIPGLVILALYGHSFVSKAVTVFHESSILPGMGILVAAWLIGVVVDNFGFVPFAYLLERLSFNKTFGNVFKKLLKVEQTPDVETPNDEERMHIQKFDAEKTMYRTLWMLFFFTLVVPPSFSAEYKWRCWYGVFGFVALYSAWVWAIANPYNAKKGKCEPLETADDRKQLLRFLEVVFVVWVGIWLLIKFCKWWIFVHHPCSFDGMS